MVNRYERIENALSTLDEDYRNFTHINALEDYVRQLAHEICDLRYEFDKVPNGGEVFDRVMDGMADHVEERVRKMKERG